MQFFGQELTRVGWKVDSLKSSYDDIILNVDIFNH